MKQYILLFFWGYVFSTSVFAQLDKVCPVSSSIYDASTLNGIQLLLNTKDFTPYLVPFSKTETTSTIQLVNALQPFPPIWYQMGNPERDTGSFEGTTFLIDATIQTHGGNLTFLGSYPGEFYGAVSIDTATLLPNYSLKNYTNESSDTVRQSIDLHDFQIDENGNKLIANQFYKTIDARCLSGLEEDSIRGAYINEIIILDANDSIVFKWNPLDHLSVCEMDWAYKEASLTFGNIINWSHINSIRFANDGNIIYSYRHIGLGKINRTTGEIMWKLGGKDSMHSIPLDDSCGYFLQHDFSQWKNGLYSIFSNGDDNHPYLEGLVYEIDEVNKKAKLVQRYKPEPETFSKALGNYECYGDTCLINFGLILDGNKTGNQTVAHILKGEKIAAVVALKANNFAYQIHLTSWSPEMLRPKICVKKKTLSTELTKGFHDYKWYKIDTTTATPVGEGLQFSPETPGKYVVEAQTGSGIFTSFVVSEIISYKRKYR